MKRIKVRKRIYSWNQASKGAKALARELGWLRLTGDARNFVPRPQHLVVNWGSSTLPEGVDLCRIVNRPKQVKIAADKAYTYTILADDEETQPYIPLFWGRKESVAVWMQENPKRTVMCRTVLNGHGGQGIRFATRPEELVDAPLYVEYVPKKAEYRIHVLTRGKVGVDEHDLFLFQEKKRNMAVPDDQVDWRVRNHGNGFIFARDGVRAPDPVIRASQSAVRSLGLHFGAVDIGWNIKSSRATIYEINTAPGLEGSTVREYADYFKGLV